MENIVFTPARSKSGIFIDYFGKPINIGDTIVFKSNDFRNDNNFYRAKVKDLIARKGDYGLDYCLLEEVEAPRKFGSKIKNGSKKCCQNCIVIK